jgi:hypothetical protein
MGASRSPPEAEAERGSSVERTSESDQPHRASSLTRSAWPDLLGVLWVVVAACVALVPALVHGSYLGSYDLMSLHGLTARPGVVVHNATNEDEINQVIPWISLAWMQVHHGHLPLWNPYEALGMPFAFNIGSGVFALPALVSYLTPLHFVYLVQILVSLIVGGTGAYFFGRVLRLHPIACAFAGTTWVLSGPFFGYLGLPDTSVMSWAGWQFGAAVLIVRGTRRWPAVVLLAVSFAFSILAGNPQIEVIILVPFVAFVAVVLLCRTTFLRGSGQILRPVFDLALAFVLGGALAAPLALPGLQLASDSARSASAHASALPPSQVLGVFFESFWGLPVTGDFVSFRGFFPLQYAWVGALAVVLTVVAVRIRWRQPEVVGLAAAAACALAASVLQPADSLLNQLPAIGSTWWFRSLIPLAFCLAMLAGVGLDAVFRQPERRQATRWALGALGAVAGMLALLWLFGRGGLPVSSAAASVRNDSFVWPVTSTAVGLAGFGLLALAMRSRRTNDGRRPVLPVAVPTLAVGVALSLLVCQTVFLVVGDGPLPSSSSTSYEATTAVASLERLAGSSLVGLGNEKYAAGGLGVAEDSNVLFMIHEFSVYDPIVPLSWFWQWTAANGTLPGDTTYYQFSPDVANATIARRYGVSFVLEGSDAPVAPGGTVFVGDLGNEKLYAVPGAARATLVPATSGTSWPGIDAHGTRVALEWLGPSTLRIVTNATSPQVLRLRVSSVPGWRATVDGRSVTPSPYLGMMFQLRVPAGHHVIEFDYWPTSFTVGIVLAGLAVVVIAVLMLVEWRQRRHSVRASPGP